MISSLVALAMEIVTTISGLIIPRLIIGTFGSEVNGLVSSITQFLGYLSLLQLGVGGVIRAALYKPISDSDSFQISRIIKAADIFFGRIAMISVVYIVVLATLYPIVSNNTFSFLYVFSLVIILGLDTVAQYAWGFSKRQLLYADQHSYIFDLARIISIVCNVLLTVLLINAGCEIHIVKLGSAFVFVLQPYVINRYTVKHYHINNNVEPDNGAVRQRWAGVGYSLADFVHKKTDIFVLTILSNLKEVSVYSIYSLVVTGIDQIISMATYSFQAALGDMYAKKESEILNNTIKIYSYLVHSLSAVVFSTTICLIVPFVSLYTNGITDVDYRRPVFALLIVLAELLYCLRQPYQSMISAAGHFKQTQRGAILEAVINIILSIILVTHYGIVGVAIGTVFGMIYRTLDLIVYLKSNILYLKYVDVFKRYAITGIEVTLICGIFFIINPYINSVAKWVLYAIVILIVSCFIVIIFSLVFYKKTLNMTLKKLRNVIIRR